MLSDHFGRPRPEKTHTFKKLMIMLGNNIKISLKDTQELSQNHQKQTDL